MVWCGIVLVWCCCCRCSFCLCTYGGHHTFTLRHLSRRTRIPPTHNHNSHRAVAACTASSWYTPAEHRSITSLPPIVTEPILHPRHATLLYLLIYLHAMTAALPPPSLVASIEEPTCCPEDELVPCTACYEKHKAEEASVEELPFTDLQQAAASLLRIPPPSIPHGHAASAPEDITHHQAHARQLPAPNPPDPRTAHSEKSGPLLAASATERTNGRETNSTAQPAAAAVAEEAAEEEPTCCPEEAELVPCSACYEKMHGHHSSPPSSATATAAAPSYAAPSAPSPLPASYPLTANTVDYNNAGVGTQGAYNVGSAMPLSTQQQQQQQMQAYSMQQPYGQLAYTASPPPSVMYGQPTMQQSQQQVDMYGNMYQQQIGAMQMPQQQQPQYMCQPGPAMYQPFPAPLTMAGPNGGTLVYYPNPAQNGAVDSSAQSQLQSPPVIQQPQQISHQVPSPGLMGYYQQPQQQPQLQLAQQQHSVSAQQPATLAFQQQPVAYVNNIPMYYTTQPPLPQQQQQQQTQPEQPAQHHSLYLPASAPASTVTSPSSSIAGDSLRSFSDVDKTCATYKTEICRSHQYSGACEYGSSCQFAHGLDELRTRDVDPKYKTERCKNYHAFGPSTCWYGPRCKFIHDESVKSHTTTACSHSIQRMSCTCLT